MFEMSKKKASSTRLEAFAPVAFYKIKVRDLVTDKAHMYLLFDAGDIEMPGGTRAPLPLVIMDEKMMQQQMALSMTDPLLHELQRQIAAHRKPAADLPPVLPSVDVVGE